MNSLSVSARIPGSGLVEAGRIILGRVELWRIGPIQSIDKSVSALFYEPKATSYEQFFS